MNKLHLFIRSKPIKSKFVNPTCLYCTNKNDEGPIPKEDEKKAKDKNEKGSSRLNELLMKMVDHDKQGKTALNLAKPKAKKGLKTKEPEEQESVSTEKQMVKAVQDVASEIGGNVKQTESELLVKLLNPVPSDMASSASLSDIVKGMKIDRETKAVEDQSRAEQVKQLLQRIKAPKTTFDGKVRTPKRPLQKRGPELHTEKIDLFGSSPLGIFTNKDKLKDGVENKTWNSLMKRELRLAVTHPPANYFQEQILWTKQGKIWKFPIDNEQGLEKEKSVYFADHVFLEKHLEPWCPTKGPIRHFMELVCVGLSKNPYITVETKIEHIEWYKNYFEDKKKLLQEVGAIPTENKPKAKQIE